MNLFTTSQPGFSHVLNNPFEIERDAMGSDEYHPISNRGENISSKSSGVGYTVLDAIDTMYIMGLDAEYSRARYWVKTKLVDFDVEGVFSTFEVSFYYSFIGLTQHGIDHHTCPRRLIDHGPFIRDRI